MSALYSVRNGWRADDARVHEDVVLVRAGGRELRDHSAFLAGLEPVPGVGRDGVLLARRQRDLVPHRIGGRAARGRTAVWPRRGLARDVEVDAPAAAAERLLLAWPPIDGRVAVLWTGLVREEHQLLGAVAIGVDVGDERQALALQLAEP